MAPRSNGGIGGQQALFLNPLPPKKNSIQTHYANDRIVSPEVGASLMIFVDETLGCSSQSALIIDETTYLRGMVFQSIFGIAISALNRLTEMTTEC
jgi:hypothetical protein